MHALKIKYGAALGALSLFLAGCEGDTILSPQNGEDRIYVSGRAVVQATPDIARAQVGVQTFAETLEEALVDNNARTEAVLASLKASGIAAEDLQTSQLNISPRYDFDEEGRTQVLVGYWVNNSVAVDIRDLDRVGEALQAAVEAGANNVNSLFFGLDDEREVKAQARTEAVADARTRAQTLAVAAGVELGKVLSVREISGGGPVFARGNFDEVADEARVPIEIGQLEIGAQVEVVYAIK